MTDQPCSCHECITAGCTRPPVTLAASGRWPQRELHGRELVKFYADREARKGWLTKLVEDFRAKGIAAQRGDEPR
jgi:hypothetical protein